MYVYVVCFLLLMMPFLKADEENFSDIIIDATNRLGFEVYRTTIKNDENIVISPIGLSSVLAMAYSGSAGSTETEMNRILHLELSQSQVSIAFGDFLYKLRQRFTVPHISFECLNSLWLQRGKSINSEFKDQLQTHYKASIEQVDFLRGRAAARLRMNNWVDMHTRGRVRVLLDLNDLTQDIRMLLVNVMYLQAQWEKPFRTTETKQLPFFLYPSKTVSTAMMHKIGEFPFFQGRDYAMLELPYNTKIGSELSMLIVLPTTTYGLSQLESTFNASDFFQGLKQLKLQGVEIFLPRFNFPSTVSFKDSLLALGLKAPFSDAADFSRIDGSMDLKLSKIWQKALISVDEKGTEAAAATAASVSVKSFFDTSRPKLFNANHPFMFAIVDKSSGVILFLGHFVLPQ